MKYTLFTVICMFLFAQTPVLSSSNSSWLHDVIIEGDFYELTPGNSQVDSQNGLHIAYGRTDLKYAYQSTIGEPFETELVCLGSGEKIVSRLVVTPDNVPIIAWIDSLSLKLNLARKTTSGWVLETLKTVDVSTDCFSLILDTDSKPVLILHDEQLNHLYLMHIEAGEWRSVSIDSEANYSTDCIVSDRDSNDKLHVTVSGTESAFYYYPVAEHWCKENIGFYDNIRGCDFELDSNDSPEIILLQNASVFYCFQSVNGWERKQISISKTNYSWLYSGNWTCDIVIDANNTTWIAFPNYDSVLNQQLIIVKSDGISTTTVVNEPIHNRYGFSFNFFLRNGNPCLVYREGMLGTLSCQEFNDSLNVKTLIDCERIRVETDLFVLDQNDLGHIIYYSPKDNTVYHLSEGEVEWNSTPIYSGAPLNPSHCVHLAMEMDANSNPVIACGIENSKLFLFRYDVVQSVWSRLELIENDFPGLDLGLHLDSNDSAHLIWRTKRRVEYISEKSGFSSIKILHEASSSQRDVPIGSVSLAKSSESTIAAGYMLSSGYVGEKYGIESSYVVKNVGTSPDDFLYSSLVGLSVHSYPGFHLINDRFGSLLFGGSLYYYYGCPPPTSNMYLGKINGYPDIESAPGHRPYVFSFTSDSNGNIWTYDGHAINSFKIVDYYQNPRPGFVQEADFYIESVHRFISMRLTQYDNPRLCYSQFGDLTVSTLFSPLIIQLKMPNNYFSPGDKCSIDLDIAVLENYRGHGNLFCALEIAGQYFFWPSWSSTQEYHPVLIASNLHYTILPEFTWPETGPDVMGPITIHALILNSENTDFLDYSGIETWTFNYGPAL